MREIYLLVGILIALIGCATTNSSTFSSNEYINSAQAKLNNQQYAMALESATMAIKADNSNYMGYYLAAQAYQNLHKVSQAYQSYQKAVSLNQQDINLLLNYANFLCANQYSSPAMSVYSSALQVSPLSSHTIATIYIANGDCLVSQNRLDDAVDSYIKALQDESAPLNAYIGISYAYILQKNYATAYYYMALYNGKETSQSLQMKITALTGLLNSDSKLSDSNKLRLTLANYQKQLSELSSKSLITASYVAAPAKKISIADGTVPIRSAKISASLSENMVSLAAKYPPLQPRIKTTTENRHFIIVEKGDTLYNLALRAQTTPANLIKINKIKLSDIQIGSKIYLD